MPKKEKGFNAKILMPAFIVMIMVMSVFGYMWGSAKTKMDYNGYKFYYIENQGFLLKINESRVAFNYYPTELMRVNATPGIDELFNGPMAYAAYAPNSTYAESIAELQFNLGKVLGETKGIYIQNSFTSENEYNMPVIGCENASTSIPVLIIEKSNTTSVVKEGACIVLNFKTRQDLFAAYERLLYSILGVME